MHLCVYARTHVCMFACIRLFECVKVSVYVGMHSACPITLHFLGTSGHWSNPVNAQPPPRAPVSCYCTFLLFPIATPASFDLILRQLMAAGRVGSRESSPRTSASDLPLTLSVSILPPPKSASMMASKLGSVRSRTKNLREGFRLLRKP